MMAKGKTGGSKQRWSDAFYFISPTRLEFLDAAFALVPTMETDLQELLLSCLRGAPKDREFPVLALEAWIKRYNLTDRWCRRWLWTTFWFYFAAAEMCPNVSGRLRILPFRYDFNDPLQIEVPPPPDPFSNSFPSESETIKQWRKRVADTALAAYRQEGCLPTPELRSPEHLSWLAGYQCCGWSQNAIADATGKDRAGVSRAIHRVAQQIKLTLRPVANNDRRCSAEKIRACLSPWTWLCALKVTCDFAASRQVTITPLTRRCYRFLESEEN
jgi:hypothetical protein